MGTEYTVRTRRKLLPRGVKDEYPTRDARLAHGVYPTNRITSRVAPSEAEVHAMRCRQCSAPIEDYTVLERCWHCGSDNFTGRMLGPVSTT